MSIKKYIAEADTTITDAYQPYSSARAHYSNMGASDSLQVFSIAHKDLAPELCRILVRFPISKIIEDRSSGALPASGSMKFFLNLYNVEHPETLPTNYEMVVKPVSGSWEEGFGLDLENFLDLGQTQTGGYGVGWKYRSSIEVPYVWASDGGDYYDTYHKYFHFQNGTEDLKVDITDVVERQISGDMPNHGFGIMLADQYETGSSGISYYTKRFSSRSSQYFYNLPCISAVWESLIEDDRNNFYYSIDNLSEEDNKHSIYFFNKINGSYKNLPSNIIPFVKIIDSNNNIILDNIQSQKISNGKFKATFSLTGSTEETYTDVWYSGSQTYYSGEIQAKSYEFNNSIEVNRNIINITNLKKKYSKDEVATLRIFVRNKDWSPNIYKKFTQDIETINLKDLYYKIIRIVDNKIVLDYGYNDVKYTKCSYDINGNFCEIDMSILEPGFMYGICFTSKNDDTKIEYKDIFKFKVE